MKKFRENELEKRRIDALKLRTKVIQRNLPLPIKLNELYKTLSNSENNKVNIKLITFFFLAFNIKKTKQIFIGG